MRAKISRLVNKVGMGLRMTYWTCWARFITVMQFTIRRPVAVMKSVMSNQKVSTPQPTPPPHCQWTPHANAPPLERRNMAPLASPPPLSKEASPPKNFQPNPTRIAFFFFC